jgi:transposase
MYYVGNVQHLLSWSYFMSFVQLQKAGRGEKPTTYVLLATSKRIPGKKHPTQVRTHLGCLCDDNPNMVIVAKSYAGPSHVLVSLQALKEIAKQGEEVVTKWLQQQSNGNTEKRRSTMTQLHSDDVAQIKRVGVTHLLKSIAASIGLDKILESCFNVSDPDGSALLYLAFYQVVERRPLYLADYWLNEQLISPKISNYDFSSSGISCLSMQIGNNTGGTEQFFKMWIKKLGAPSSLIFDTTSVSSYSEQLDFAEWGYNRDGEQLPQINLSLVSSRQTSLPVYYRILPGSIPDVSSLKVTVEILRELGISDYVTSLDRGFFSNSNIRTMIKNGIGFVIGASQSCAQTAQLILKHQAALRSPKQSIEHNGNIVRHIADKWVVDMGDGEKKELDAHIYWDYGRHSAQEKDLESKLFQLCAKAHKDMPDGYLSEEDAVAWIKENAKGYSTLLKPVVRNLKYDIERNVEAMEKVIEKKGFTIVLTTKTGASGVEILDDYRSRDKVEKLFDILKNENGQNRLYSGNQHAVSGRLFIAFIALVIHTELENRMKKANLLKKYSVSELLSIVRKLECVTMESGNRYLMEITKAQREIYDALKIPEPTVVSLSES